jgi:hypothetical protein
MELTVLGGPRRLLAPLVPSLTRAQGKMGRTAFAAKDIFNALVYLYRSIPIIDRSVMEEEIMHEHLCCYVYFVGHLHAYLYVTDW